ALPIYRGAGSGVRGDRLVPAAGRVAGPRARGAGVCRSAGSATGPTLWDLVARRSRIRSALLWTLGACGGTISSHSCASVPNRVTGTTRVPNSSSDAPIQPEAHPDVDPWQRRRGARPVHQ